VQTQRKMLLCLLLKIEVFVSVCRLVEEMASMQKCLELGELYYGQAYGLCRLLAHRFTWLQQSFGRWRKTKHKFEIPQLAVPNRALHFSAVHIRIRMMAALIPLRALFLTYISKYPTTHPISEVWQWDISGCHSGQPMSVGPNVTCSVYQNLIDIHTVDSQLSKCGEAIFWLTMENSVYLIFYIIIFDSFVVQSYLQSKLWFLRSFASLYKYEYTPSSIFLIYILWFVKNRCWPQE
jgi:hypothetical protein